MFGFLRKNAALSSTSPSTTALVPVSVPAPVTADVTADATGSLVSTIASSWLMTKWAEPKPFPAYRDPEPGGTVQVWPVDKMPARWSSAEHLAKELLAAMQRQPTLAGRWVLAISIERIIYPEVCQQLQWPPRHWYGKNGAARCLADLLPQPPVYKRVEIGGAVRELHHYFILSATAVELVGRRRA